VVFFCHHPGEFTILLFTTFLQLCFMSKKELLNMQKGLKRQHAEVTKSKVAARKLLLDLKLITPKGNLTTVFKPVR